MRFSKQLIFQLLIVIGTLKFSTNKSYSQVIFPVEVTTQVLPPYSSFLEDYAQPGYDRFLTTIFVKDFSAQDIEVKVGLVIYGDNGSLVTINKLDLQTPLTGGSTVTFTGHELQSLFDINNLSSSNGLTQQYSTGGLPEGFYTFNIEVFTEVSGRDVPVSNNAIGGAMVLITREEPPFLNFPQNESLIEPTSPQNIQFMWTPRHIKSSDAFENTKYRFRMVEVPEGRHPNDAINSVPNPIIDDVEVDFTVYNFTIEDPILDPQVIPEVDYSIKGQMVLGKQYAWRVEVIDERGREIFENDGYSEVYSFYYARECPSVELIEYSTTEDGAIDVAVMPNAAYSDYRFFYRIFESGASYSVLESEYNSVSIEGLDPATTYEVKVVAGCQTVWPDEVYAGLLTTQGTAIPSCDIPEGIQYQVHDVQVDFSWSEVPGAINYEIFVGEEKHVTSDISLTLTDLPTEQDEITIRAVCDGVNSDLSDPFKLDLTPTDDPVTACVAPLSIGFKAEESTSGDLVLLWFGSNVFDSYTLRVKAASNDTWEEILLTEPTYSISNWEYGELYDYQIKYQCGDEQTDFTNTNIFVLEEDVVIIETADCFPPSNITSEKINDTTFSLEWNGIDKAEFYTLVMREQGTDAWQSFEIRSNLFEYTLAEIGKTYEYKVQPYCDQKYGVFSEVFDYTNEVVLETDLKCESVEDVVLKDSTSSSLSVVWLAQENHTQFVVEYKPEDSNSSTWFEEAVTTPSAVLRDLKPSFTYSVRVKAFCDHDAQRTSSVSDFTTAAGDPDEFNCGANGNYCNRSNQEATPIAEGDNIYATDFELLITEIKSNDGDKYSGRAQMVIPIQDYLKVNLEFTDLVVNVEKCMISGKMHVDTMNLYVIDDESRAALNGAFDAVDDALNTIDNYANMSGDQIFDEAMNVFEGQLDNLGVDPEEIRQYLSDYDKYMANFNDIKTKIADLKSSGKSDAEKTTLKQVIASGIGEFGSAMKVIQEVAALIKSIGALLEEVKNALTGIKDRQQDEVGVPELSFDDLDNVTNDDPDADDVHDVQDPNTGSGPRISINVTLDDAYQAAMKAYQLYEANKARIQLAEQILNDEDILKAFVFEVQMDALTILTSSVSQLENAANGLITGISINNIESKFNDLLALKDQLKDLPLFDKMDQAQQTDFKNKLLVYLEQKLTKIAAENE